ncbi:MAG: polysaccharide biosynthesis tyrosine autokinase [Alloprevotella sp.]|nr:polysaccharide biosynthesis tyrosine autokinase [Alloprevotella sp.]
MATTQSQTNRQEEVFSLKDLWFACISHWYWFLISLAICFAIAIVYLLYTPPTFTRSMSVLIKEEDRGGSVSTDVASTFSELGLSRSNTNVDNEMVNIQSPDLLYEVVKRLNLDVNYVTEGPFRKRLIYGDQLPFTVKFNNFDDYETASFTATPKSASEVVLTDFKKMGKEVDSKPIVAKLGTTIKSPIGLLTLTETPYKPNLPFEHAFYITRSTIDGVIARYKSWLKVDYAEDGTSIVKLTLNDKNIQRADDVLNTIMLVYNERWMNDKNQIVKATDGFINERLRILQEELGDIDSKITSSKSANKLPDLSSSASFDLQQSMQQTQQIMDLNTQLRIASDLSAYISRSNNKLLPNNVGINDLGIQSLINEYNELQLRRNSVVASSSNENVLVKDYDEQLASLKSNVVQSVNNYISALKIQLAATQNARAQADSRVSNIPQLEGLLLSPERQQKVKEALYLFLLQKREENQLSQAFTNTNSRVVSTPERSGARVSTAPVKRKVFLVALLAGLLIPFAIIFLREITNTVVRGRKDLERMQTPFVGELPEMASKKKKKSLFERKKTQEKETPKIVVKANSRNIINEAFRVIRTNLEFLLNKEAKSHVIMITSANPNSGKTFISANLSTAMAIKGNKVLAIDLDLRKRSLSEYFGSPRKGISDYLSGQSDDYKKLIVNYENSGTTLDVLGVGTLPPNPAELLASERMHELMEDVRNNYDYIILDCPPVEIVTDADIINAYADTTLFIIRAGLLDRSVLPDIDDFYINKKYKNMCMILNCTDSGSHYGYRYGYKYGYGYGRYGYGYGRYGYGYGRYGYGYGSESSKDDDDE